MAGLSLSLFGEFSVSIDGQPVEGFRTRLAQALLIYLASQPERHRREHLMALFWPDLPQASAQQNLRQNLYLLRQTLGDVSARDGGDPVPLILADREFLQLNPAAEVAVDACRVDEILDMIQPNESRLQEAVDLYDGEFLTDFVLPYSDPFEQWALVQRESYRRSILDALRQLTELALIDEDYARAEGYVRRELTIEPLQEAANRRLIEILARSDRRISAINHFEAYRDLLLQDLELTPGAETMALVDLVRSGDLPVSAPDQRPIRGYKLEDELGRSNYAIVYRAIQATVGRQVAVKVIAARYADNIDFIRRFEAEAQIIARLEHPNIVPLYDFWREPGGAFLVMRWLRGGDLRMKLASGALSLENNLKLLDQVASALQEAHDQGVVHCDIKPGNILLDETGNAYLSDFGISRLLQAGNGQKNSDLFLGTPDYLAPEQARMEEVTPASDQYSLGMVMYEALTGRRPFETTSMAELFQKHVSEPLGLVHEVRPDVPQTVDDVLQRATAKDPSDRYLNVIAFAHAFRAALVPRTGEVAAADDILLPLRNPYKGLLPFDEADTLLFFGREAMTAQLVKRLNTENTYSRFLAVVGPSGSGKSSLVKAGLVPALRQGACAGSENWFIVPMKMSRHPFDELEATVLRVAVHPPAGLAELLRSGPNGLRDAVIHLGSAISGNELVLIIDQFEELFTLTEDSAEVAAFLDSLSTAVMDPNCPIRVIITLRADFYDRPLLYAPFSELMRQRTEVVVPLTPEELMRAIVRPAARVGVGVEPALVTMLVSDLLEQPGALPLLQYTLSELFEHRVGDQLTRDTYEALGGIQGALSQRAEVVYSGLTPAEQRATRAIFSRLVTLGSGSEATKRRVLLEELISLDPGPAPQTAAQPDQPVVGQTVGEDAVDAPESAIVAAIDQFGRARLLSFDRDRATRGSTVEIAHEALLAAWPRLAIWLDVDRVSIRLGRLLTQATDEWLESGRQEGFLLRESRLDQMAPLAGSGIALTEEERLFLAQSLAARDERIAKEEARRQNELEVAQSLARVETQRAEEEARAARRLRGLAAVLSVVMLLAAAAAVLAYSFARDSEQNAAVAATREFEALSNAELAATREAEAIASLALATSRELSQAASNTLDADPELSILLSLQALDNAKSREAEEGLHQALQSIRTVASFPTGARGHFGAVLAADPERRRVATVDDTQVTIWDAANGTLSRSMPLVVPTSEHYQLTFNSAGDKMALVNADTDLNKLMLQTWDLNSGETDTFLDLPIRLTDSSPVTLSPDWQLLSVGFEDGRVELWDVAGQRLLHTLTAHEDAVVDVAFDPGGSLLATAGRDGLVHVWAVDAAVAAGESGDNSADPAHTVDGSASTQGFGGLVHIAMIGDTGLALGYLGGVEVWQLNDTDRPQFTLQGETKLTRKFSVSPDLSQLATGGQDGTGQIWDLATGSHLLSLAQHPSPVDDLAFSPDARQVMTLDRDGLLRVWDARLSHLGEQATLSVDPAIFDLELSPDGRQIALGNAGGPASVWDLSTGSRQFLMPGDFGGVYRLDYSSDGRRLAAVGSDNKIRLWDATTGDLMATFEGHGSGLAGGLFPGTLDVAFSPDGSRLATAGSDGLAIIWEVATGRQLQTLAGHTDSLHSLAWSPDGRTIVTTSDEDDTSVRLWDAETGALLHTLLGHVVRVWGVAFSPDSRTLITGGARGIIKAWDVATGTNLYTIVDEADHIGTVTFTPDGQEFITTGEVPLRVRRTSDGEARLTVAQPLIWSARVSQDGRWLYGGDVEGVVRVFALHLDDAVGLAQDRLTRWWRPDECLRYLHSETCPPPPAVLSP